MGELSARNFGLLIAYIVPGSIILWGLSVPFPPLSLWLYGFSGTGPTAASIACMLLGSVTCGMAASTVRWALIDTLHHATGVRRPDWDDARLVDRLPVYQFLIEIHYRYYQFHANTLVAGVLAYGLWRAGGSASGRAWLDVGMLFLGAVFYAGSRDALQKYYSRTASLLGVRERMVPHDERRETHESETPGAQDPEGSSGASVTDQGGDGGGGPSSGEAQD